MNKMFSKFLVLLLTLSMAISMVACGTSSTSSSSSSEGSTDTSSETSSEAGDMTISVSADVLQLYPGETAQISVVVTGTDESDYMLTAAGVDGTTLSAAGVVTAGFVAGAYTVTAKIASDRTITDSVEITILEAPVDEEDFVYDDDVPYEYAGYAASATGAITGTTLTNGRTLITHNITSATAWNNYLFTFNGATAEYSVVCLRLQNTSEVSVHYTIKMTDTNGWDYVLFDGYVEAGAEQKVQVQLDLDGILDEDNPITQVGGSKNTYFEDSKDEPSGVPSQLTIFPDSNRSGIQSSTETYSGTTEVWNIGLQKGDVGPQIDNSEALTFTPYMNYTLKAGTTNTYTVDYCVNADSTICPQTTSWYFVEFDSSKTVTGATVVINMISNQISSDGVNYVDNSNALYVQSVGTVSDSTWWNCNFSFVDVAVDGSTNNIAYSGLTGFFILITGANGDKDNVYKGSFEITIDITYAA